MKIIQHGVSIIFICPDCGCVFSELPSVCYSSTGDKGANYCMECPDCGCVCWANDPELKKKQEFEWE